MHLFRAGGTRPVTREDLRARKLCCANGGGKVHSINYDLEEQFGIRLARSGLEQPPVL